MENNIYEAPESLLIEDEEVTKSYKLASRWKRLVAAFIDGILIMIPTFGAMYFMGTFETIQNGQEPSFLMSIALLIIGVVFYLIFNFKTLNSNGQTLGKKACNIKVVDLDNRKPSMASLVIVRYGSFVVAGQIPGVGQFLSFINLLFIFGKEKRCIHDHIAKTKVVETNQQN